MRTGWQGKAKIGFPKALLALAIAVGAMALYASVASAAPVSFPGPTSFEVDDGPLSIAAADLDGDGFPDL